MTNVHTANKAALRPLFKALYDFEPEVVQHSLRQVFAKNCPVQLAYPFETLDGAPEFYHKALSKLLAAIPDLEYRQTIFMAGASADERNWVGSGGYYTGSFEQPFLGIPPTGHQVNMRFHEFYCLEHGLVTEMQALWDIPEIMLQANAWPMPKSLGREWHVPAPATQDGLIPAPYDSTRSQESFGIVAEMLHALGNFAKGGVPAMQLDKYWHPRISWYGPAGIGTGRGIAGFRNWHQIPFLKAMPDRVGSLGAGNLFADGDYVGFTKWPGMQATISNDGWMGIAPSNQKITMRSLDFWRVEQGLIRENWVLVDLLDVYRQIGVDVFSRMQEMTKARFVHYQKAAKPERQN